MRLSLHLAAVHMGSLALGHFQLVCLEHDDDGGGVSELLHGGVLVVPSLVWGHWGQCRRRRLVEALVVCPQLWHPKVCQLGHQGSGWGLFFAKKKIEGFVQFLTHILRVSSWAVLSVDVIEHIMEHASCFVCINYFRACAVIHCM